MYIFDVPSPGKSSLVVAHNDKRFELMYLGVNNRQEEERER
jgi:hypothetical protein